MSRPLRLGTRGSRLALRQTDLVAAALGARHSGLSVERRIITTIGDRILDAPLSRIGDKGLFTKELDLALIADEIDLAVHSLKDLPTRVPEELTIGAILEREDPRDALVSTKDATLDTLASGARVGTSSLRRRAQLLALRPDLEVVDLRGNVPSRLGAVDRGDVDAIVLARAGLVRLGLGDRITETLGPDRMLSAVGQGAIAVVIRRGDAAAARLAAAIDHAPTRLAVWAERSLLRRLEGGCQVPIGALARLEGTRLVLGGLVADLDGTRILRSTEDGPIEPPARQDPDAAESRAAAVGERLAETLIGMGAKAILERIFADARAVPRPLPSGGGPDE